MMTAKSTKPLYNRRRSLVPNIVCAVICILFICYEIFISFVGITLVLGISMQNTIDDKTHVLVQQIGFDVERDKIYTIDHSTEEKPNHILIKRIVGTGGDKLLFMKTKDGLNVRLYRCTVDSDRFTLLDENYIKEPMKLDYFKKTDVLKNIQVCGYISQDIVEGMDITKDYTNIFYELCKEEILKSMVSVPENSIFYLGDNRNVSADSRRYGMTTADKVRSKYLKQLKHNSFEEKFFKFLFNIR